MDYPDDPILLRKIILQKRKTYPEKVREELFAKIMQNFFNSVEYVESRNILGYYGKVTSGEFNTRPLLQKILDDGKRLFLPRCQKGQIQLDVYEIFNLEQDIEMGAYDIMEPLAILGRKIEASQMDIIIVPGSVFDVAKNRYGYGAGYYDALLKNFKGYKIAFALDFTVMKFNLRTHPADIPMTKIITEYQTY